MSLLEAQQTLVAQVSEAGYTPFDLLSWQALVVLDQAAKSIDPLLFSGFGYEITKEIRKAFRRKAELLDTEQNTTFYTDLFKSFTE